MPDFTLVIYSTLLKRLIENEFLFKSFADHSQSPNENHIILRHDVDARPNNSLEFVKIQAKYNIRGSYYFRMVAQSFDVNIIKEIASMGHEIGYHYETMDSARGDVDKAYDDFCRNLERFRKIVPVETICMHGSPLSKFDNRAIWKKYDYKSLGILAEPYFDLDFNKVYYLTDTGRRWDGDTVSIRDKAMASNPITNPDFNNRRYRTTRDIIKAIENKDFPGQVMMTFHPQRWTDQPLPWLKELVMQNAKNVVKRWIVKRDT